MRRIFLTGKAIWRRSPDGFQVNSTPSWQEKALWDGVLTVLKQTAGAFLFVRGTHAYVPPETAIHFKSPTALTVYSVVSRKTRHRDERLMPSLLAIISLLYCR